MCHFLFWLVLSDFNCMDCMCDGCDGSLNAFSYGIWKCCVHFKFVEEFSNVAQEMGLRINPQKCELLIRDPNNAETQSPPSLPIGRFNIPVVEKLKYLGVYVTSNLNRPMIVWERIKMAYKIAHSLLPFLRMQKLPLELILKIYETTVAPVATYMDSNDQRWHVATRSH